MAVAWIGSRETHVRRAAEHAAEILQSSRCPVFSLDTDIHGTRAAIALAERVGAAYDHVDGAALAAPTALFTGRGGLTIAPGQARRRADVLVLVGDVPAAHRPLVAELAATRPDLAGGGPRTLFTLGVSTRVTTERRRPTRLACGEAGTAGTLAALRAELAGRPTAARVSGLETFAGAVEAAHFVVFVTSGAGLDALALEMLQGLADDIGRSRRAATLFLPASEAGWGSTLASGWMTGFPLRTGFQRGMPEYDPWRFAAERMLVSGEADAHLLVTVSTPRGARRRTRAALIALAPAEAPVNGAAVTMAIGRPGVDHAGVAYAARTGTLQAVPAAKPSAAAEAAAVLGEIAAALGDGAWPC